MTEGVRRGEGEKMKREGEKKEREREREREGENESEDDEGKSTGGTLEINDGLISSLRLLLPLLTGRERYSV